MRWRCDDCDRSFSKVPLTPMLHDRVWLKLASADETLCGSCFFERAIQRDIRLTLASLRPCHWNLDRNLGNPSWFDVFSTRRGSDRDWNGSRQRWLSEGRATSAIRVFEKHACAARTTAHKAVTEISMRPFSPDRKLTRAD